MRGVDDDPKRIACWLPIQEAEGRAVDEVVLELNRVGLGEVDALGGDGE